MPKQNHRSFRLADLPGSLIASMMIVWLVFASGADRARAQTASKTEIPFRLTPWTNISVPAVVNERYGVNLMFHTGIDSVSLTPTTIASAPNLKLDKETDSQSWGGNSRMRSGTIRKLTIGPVLLEGVVVHQSMNSGHETDGKFGIPQLNSRFVEIDFDSQKIVTHDTLPAKVESWQRIDLSMQHGLMFIEARLLADAGTAKEATERSTKRQAAGEKNKEENRFTDPLNHKFMIHSGYSGFALLDDAFVKAHSSIGKLPIVEESELKDSAGNVIKTQKTSVPTFSVGKFSFEQSPVSFFSGSIGRQKISVLGQDFLRRFNLLIDLEHKHLYLTKSNAYNDKYFLSPPKKKSKQE
ncbi:MAG: hypothetical protein AAFN77_19915 [Planctomycetota bacterium]